jgi:hypothetical protein
MFEEAADFMRFIGVEPPGREDLRYGGVIGSAFIEDAVFPAGRKGICAIEWRDNPYADPRQRQPG